MGITASYQAGWNFAQHEDGAMARQVWPIEFEDDADFENGYVDYHQQPVKEER